MTLKNKNSDIDKENNKRKQRPHQHVLSIFFMLTLCFCRAAITRFY